MFLERLAGHTLFRHNCTRIHLPSGQEETLSSPYVSSIAARVLLTLPDHPLKNDIILKTKEYLLNVMRPTGLIGFIEPNEHRYDLDTQACVYNVLFRFGSEQIISKVNNIVKFFLENKCNQTGAYYTWVNKEKNNVDYFVNINIRMFFKTIGIQDPTLDKYLLASAYKFIRSGSRYYRDLSFPVFLTYLYINNEGLTRQEQYLAATLNRLLYTRKARSVAEDIKSMVHRHMSINGYWKCRLFRQYFNSRDSYFQSKLLDNLIYYHILINPTFDRHSFRLPVQPAT